MIRALPLLLLPLTLLLGQPRIELCANWSCSANDPLFSPVTEALAEKGIDLVFSDLQHDLCSNEIRYVVIFNHSRALKRKNLPHIPPHKSVLFLWEPPTRQPALYSEEVASRFKRIYTWDDDLVDSKKYFKFYYPELRPVADNLPSFHQRKLLTLINNNLQSSHPQELYTARRAVIAFFEAKETNDFEFYGTGWEPNTYKNYRGSTPDKQATLKQYRFSICYENMRDVKGYITEKIFDCFVSGTIPIYWGASNIDAYIPKTCYIDRRDFKDNEELYQFLQQVDEKTYLTYLAHIKAFTQSDAAKLFSPEMFRTILLDAVRFP